MSIYEHETSKSSTSVRMIPSLLPHGDGHQFLLYGDSCSGVPDALHERTFAATNAVASRLSPPPEFIVFPGDEIIGLTTDEAALRCQWRYWLDVEMAWLDRETIPLYHTTGNHTTYDATSERVFAEMLSHLPRNGPPDQQGLSYFVRRDKPGGDLLMVFVNTLCSELGGEGHVETAWLDETLRTHADAHYKLVVGHHPVFPVNGFSGEYQREIGAAYAGPFWKILVEHGVLAYLCSHILAFDVQVHEGVLQILTAGAGTAHRMPEESEYLHCVQAALDERGLRYQVLDQDGVERERLSWPLRLPPASTWKSLPAGELAAPLNGASSDGQDDISVVAWRIIGQTASRSETRPQTLLAAWTRDSALPSLWLGLTGPSQRVTAIVGSQPGRSPHYWFGPSLGSNSDFDIQIAVHAGMGPGGFLWRNGDDSPWSSLKSSSAWGAERVSWSARWSVGYSKAGPANSTFLGANLAVWWYAHSVPINNGRNSACPSGSAGGAG